jgi:translocator protein
MTTLRRMKSTLRLAVSIINCQLVGFASVFFTMSADHYWYNAIVLPYWKVSLSLFGSVWAILYFFLGTAIWLVWESNLVDLKKSSILLVFVAQLTLHFLWSALFFRFHNQSMAFLTIAILFVLVLFSMFQIMKISKKALWLMVPYIAWICFEMLLNFKVLFLTGSCLE